MSKTVALVHSHETFQISPTLMVQKCDLFMNDPTLTASPYNVKSPVSLSDFREFVSAMKGTTVKITNNNFEETDDDRRLGSTEAYLGARRANAASRR
jgi:hypothetical protein